MSEFSVHKQSSEVLLELMHKVKVIRKGQKLSQEELALRSGVSFGSIKRFERTGKISLESLLKIAHVLGRLAEIDWIFNNDGVERLDELFSDKTR